MVARNNIIVVVRACPLKQTEYCSPLRCCTRGACARSSFPRRHCAPKSVTMAGADLEEVRVEAYHHDKTGEPSGIYTLPSLEIDSNKRNLLAINFLRRCSTLV